MARASSSSTKFASVNLNKSYGKPVSQGAQLPSSGSSRARIATHGGMLLLTRPVRSQPAAAAVQKGAKLTVPRPVNLPSLRREHAGNDPTIALVGGTGASGWTKQQQKEAEEAAVAPVPGETTVVTARSTPALSAGSTWGTLQPPPVGQPVANPPPYFAPVNGDLRPSSSPQTVVRSGVYTPPRARTVQASAPPPAPGPPAAIAKAVVLRGEDFPTLQAALPPPPAPPQHRQKELQQKQRVKQQELKDQQQKLQQLSQKHPGDEPLQPQVVVPQLQPSQPVSLQPQREQPVQNLSKETALPSEPQPAGQAGSRPGFKTEVSSYVPVLPGRVNQRSNWTDDEREPAQNLRPQGGSGPYSDWPDRSDRERPEREHFIDDPRRGNRSDDYGFGRQSTQREMQPAFVPGGREGSYNREGEGSRESGFGIDVGFAREGNFNPNHNFDNREAAFSREGMGSRDGFTGREGSISRERHHVKDGGYNREAGVSRDGGFGREGGFGRHGAFGRDGSGREFGTGKDSNLDRDGYGRPRSGGGRDFINDREGFPFREGFVKDTGPREGFSRDASYGRDSSSRDGSYNRDVRRPPSGDYEGGRGRYGGERFARGGTNRYDAVPDFANNKGSHFSSGRGVLALDAGLDFSRDKRFGVPYTEDSFARDFPDLPSLDFRASSGLGIEALAGLGLESKLGRRKKDEMKDSNFHDPERESFEAELERVQKAQEQERLRKIEEKERAVEMARKEQEEQERLAREEQERQLRLEEEAIAAANRAELEALEAARKVEDERRAREEEKRAIQLEEERRKENARRKLLELEERIAKREAEKKKQEADSSLFSEDEMFRAQRAEDEEVAISRDDVAREEEERMVASITEADQDDDDRAPLRPSRRPPSPLLPRSSQEEYPSRVKSPDLQHSISTRRMPDLRGGNAFESERSRPFMSWRRDAPDNGSGPSQSSLYVRDEGLEFAHNMIRDRMYSARNYGERDTYYGSPNSVLTSEAGPGDYPIRKDRTQGYQERRWVSEEAGPSNKRSASPRATTPERDGGYLESSYDRDGDRHWGRDKIDRRRNREVHRISPPPPPSTYLQGPDALESSSYGGRLRHSFAKQPRVPPPLRAPLLRPPLKAPRDQSNSSPSPLLHPTSDDGRNSSWDQEIVQDNQRGFTSHPARSGQTERSLSQAESGQRESSYNTDKFQGKDWLGSSALTQRGHPASSKVHSDSQDEKSDQQSVGMEQEPSSPEDDSSLPPGTPGSDHDQEAEKSEDEVLPSGERIEEGKSEEEVVYGGDEEAEEERGDVDDQEEEFDEDEEYEAGEWEDDVDQDVERSEVINESGGGGDFNSEEYESGPLDGKEGSGSEDSGEYEEKSPEGMLEGVSNMKHALSADNEQKEPPREEIADERLQHDVLQQTVTQPFLQQTTLSSTSTPLTATASVQTVSGENFENRQSLLSQLQQPLSFMALSLPQSHAAVAPNQVPSVLTSLPVLHNAQEGPVTLQFGLLPSTSLVPTTVPAIQIGSIQMPLHVHPQAGPQFTPLHGPPTPLFQFGQLGHHTSVPSFMHPSPVQQSMMQSQAPDFLASQSNGPSTQGAPLPSSQGKDQLVAGQAESHGSVPTAKSNWSNQTSKNAGELRSGEADGLDTRSGGGNGLRPERRGRERGPRDVMGVAGGQQSVSSQSKAVQRVGSEGALESSSSENSVVVPMDNNVENNQGGDSPWQRPYSGGRGRGNPTRWGASSARGRGRSGSYGGRGAPHGNFEGYGTAPGNYPQDTGSDGGLRTRPSRRSAFRRTEFKVRDSSLQGFSEGAGPAKYPGVRDKYAHMSGWSDASIPSGNFSDGAGSRENYRDSSSHVHDRYYGEGGGRTSQSALGKVERSGSTEGLQKNGRAAGYSLSRPAEGVLGKYSPDVGSEASLQSGIGQAFEQPGIEAPSDEDDFIEVRSKRQMLNDRREQKEKELKAKTKDLKAKEQAARKQRPPPKGGFQGDSGALGGIKGTSLAGVSDKKTVAQVASLDPSNSSNSRLVSSGNSPAVASSSLPSSITSAQLQPPIGTPAGGSADVTYDKRPKNSKPTRINPAPGVNLSENDVPVTNSGSYDNQENLASTTLAWGGTRSTLQVVSLTQIQLEEAMKPVRFEGPVPQQLPLGERSSLLLESGTTVGSATSKDKNTASVTGPIGSLLAGEKIQFGAVTSPPIPLTNSRPLTPGLNAVVGSSLGSRADASSDDADLKSKAKRLSGGESEVGTFTGKGKRTRGEEERSGDSVDPEAEAEAEAAASAVAVAAISSDESVGSSLHGDVQNIPLRGVGLPVSGSKSAYGSSSVTSLHSEYWPADTAITMGDATTSSVMMQASGLEESMTVALPADLSVEPTSSMSLRGPLPNSSGLLLPSMPGGPLQFRGLEMGSMLGGPMFGFGTSKDASQGPQGSTSGSVHDQGISSAGPGSGGWQPQHSGGVDSYYAGPPPSGYTGPFINPTGALPSIQGHPPMLVYTNPFASVSQFGQLGVSFMNPQQYLPSGKQPDWKHTPVSTSGPGVVGMSGNEVGGGLGGIISGQRSSGVATNVQRMAPGPSVMPTPGPFDLNLSAPFQIPGVDVSMQSQWSHVPGPPLHTVPISGPLMGFTMQTRHSRGPTHLGHLPHMMETTSGFNIVPASNPGSSGLFQSVDPAAQFPDELGLGDSSSSGTNTSSSFRGQRPSNRAPPVSSSIVTPTGGPGPGAGNNKLRSGRRSSRVSRSGGSLGAGGNGSGSMPSVGMGSSSGTNAQGTNGSRIQSPHHSTSSQMPPMSMGQHSHSNQYSDQRGVPQQGLPRVGAQGGWSGQVRKGGGPGRPPVAERGSSGEKPYVSSSSKLKQVYVVKPSSSPRRNIGEPASNLFSGSDVGQTTVGH